MKYLIIAALVGFVLALIYVRARPYLKLVRKVAESLNSVTDVSATTAQSARTSSQNKLVRCERCGTWVPADRALNLKSGLATFCSTECMAKEPVSKGRKIAG
ncbi:MAG TPA: hypothetical protein VJ656_10585 [Pyrinomonadaceae bacterium]|nr:hypothetical protein [Pyrinomonadaceae bacterium]